jgi:hypothetical protein
MDGSYYGGGAAAMVQVKVLLLWHLLLSIAIYNNFFSLLVSSKQ